MRSRDDEGLYDWPRARAGDPDTSLEAAESISITKQCRKMLVGYLRASPRAVIPHEAARLAGLTDGHQRSSDLYKAGFIERVVVRERDDGRVEYQKGVTPTGRRSYAHRISRAGLEFLAERRM